MMTNSKSIFVQIRERLNEAAVRAVLEQLGVERFDSGGVDDWLLSAPYREDRHPSLSIRRSDGVWNDKATDSRGDLVKLVQLTQRIEPLEAASAIARIIGISDAPDTNRDTSCQRTENGVVYYTYDDANGSPVGRVARSPDKRFWQERQEGGRFHKGLSGITFPLYRLPALLQSEPDDIVYLCEGEKDADRLVGLGLVATTNAGGAGKFRPEHAESLAGRHVVILPDNDKPGFKHAEKAAGLLAPHAASVRIVELPDLGERQPKHGADVSDWLDLGYSAVDLQQLASQPHAQVEDWEPPRPLHESVSPPPFPIEALPAEIADMVQATAESLQVPLGLPGMLSLSVLAVCCAGVVEIDAWGNWSEPANAYMAVVLPPAERKSAAMRLMSAPLVEYERQLVLEAKPKIADAVAQKEVLAAQYKDAIGRASKGTVDQRLAAEGEARDAYRKLDEAIIPAIPQLLEDDSTPERIVSKMAEQGGTLGVLTPEGGPFEQMQGRYSKNGVSNLDPYLKAHAGDPIKVSRQGRDDQFIPRPALTFGLAIQPYVLDGLLENRAFLGRGIVARFLFWMPEPMVGQRRVDTDAVPDQVSRRYAATINSLLALRPRFGEPRNEPYRIKLSDRAQSALRVFCERLEPRLGEFGDLGHARDWGGKLAGAVVRIAGLLHMATNVNAREPWNLPISAETMGSAITIGEALIPHAQAVYGRMGADPELAKAEHILRWVRSRVDSEYIVNSGDGLSISIRDIHQNLRRTFKKVTDLHRPIEILVEHGFLRLLPQDTTGPGRKPSPAYLINPLALEARSQNPLCTQNSSPAPNSEYKVDSVNAFLSSVSNPVSDADPPPPDEAQWDAWLAEADDFAEDAREELADGEEDWRYVDVRHRPASSRH